MRRRLRSHLTYASLVATIGVLLAFGVIGAAAPQPAEAFLIDDFNQGTPAAPGGVQVNLLTTATASDNGDVAAASVFPAFGGTHVRDVTITRTSGTSLVHAHHNVHSVDDVIAFSSDSGASGTFTLIYDNVAGTGAGNIGDIDFTAGGDSSLVADFLSIEQAASATMTVVNGADTCSLTRILPAAPTGADIAFPFSSFTGTNCALAFTSVDRVTFVVTGSATPGLDVELDELRTAAFTPPATPTITDTDPDSPANDNDPEVKGIAPAGTTVTIYGDPTCTGPVLGSGSAADFNGATGITAAGLPGDQSTDLRATASDGAGNSSGCSGAFTYTEDSQSPNAPTISDTDPDSPANDNAPEVKGTADSDAVQVKVYKDDSSCTDPPVATGTKAQFEGVGIAVPVSDDATTQFRARAVDQAANQSSCSAPFAYLEDSTAPGTTIDSGPSGATNDPTPTFTFSSSEGGSSFQCQLDAGAYSACTSPMTTAYLADGSHAISIRAIDPAGNTDLTPASRAITVRTAAVSVSGSNLVVTAATGAKDNLQITRPSASTLRVTDLAAGAYTGSGVHTGAGCTRSGDYTANCNAAGITLIKVVSGDQIDKVVNSTAVKSSLDGGAANDVLTGGSAKDILIGGPNVDMMMGMNGNDELRARDLASDTTINCGGGSADKADLDLLPKDPDAAVTNCETKTRH